MQKAVAFMLNSHVWSPPLTYTFTCMVSGLHSGINLRSAFCSETHGQGVQRKNQHVFRCHLFSSQWQHPYCCFPPDRPGEKCSSGTAWVTPWLMIQWVLHLTPDNENKKEKVESSRCKLGNMCNFSGVQHTRVWKRTHRTNLMDTLLLH